MVLLWFTYLLCNSFVFGGGPEIKSVRLSLEGKSFSMKVKASPQL